MHCIGHTRNVVSIRQSMARSLYLTKKKNFSKYHESPFVYEGTDVKTYGVCVLDIQICSFFKVISHTILIPQQ